MTHAPAAIRSGHPQRRRRFLARLATALFAEDDHKARQHNWQATETTGRFGFGARVYRDSRFDTLSQRRQ